MDKIYLVKYCGGKYDDHYTVIIFATNKKWRAIKYVSKFNRILEKWKDYYKQFETYEMGYPCIKEECFDTKITRWECLQNITKCYCEEVFLR